MRISADQALAWRLQRHFLTGARADRVDQVVERLIAVPATPTGSGDPELSIRLRLEPDPGAGMVAAALADGRLIKTFSFRGATHLMTPEQAAVHLAVRCAGRQWELTSWRTHYRLQPDDWPALRAVVRERACSPATWAELAEAVAAEPRFAHLEPEFTGENWTLLKPFMWQGDLCFGPSVDRVVTFQALASNPRWPGLMPLREAGPRVVLAYLDGYGPATAAHLQYWLGGGLSGGRRRIDGWLDQVRPQLTEVHVHGRPALVGSEHVDELRATATDPTTLLLPGYDQWVVGAGTADASIVPPALRPATTKGVGLVLVGGRAVGTWKRSKAGIEVDWAGDGEAPIDALRVAGERLGAARVTVAA